MNNLPAKILFAMLIVLIIFVFRIIHSTIDERHAQTLAASALGIVKSPQFSPEELTQEIPDGLTWTLADKDGYAFDWEAFCEQHTNCRDAFRAKGIATPRFAQDGPSPDSLEKYYECVMDAECYAKHGFDMYGNP